MLPFVVLLVCSLPFVQAQEPPRISIDRTGSFKDLASDLQSKTGEIFKIADDLDPKAITVRLQNVGFCEALDALCRAHGNASSVSENDFDSEGFRIHADPWVEYPAVYSGHYKVALVGMARFTMIGEGEDGAWVLAHLALFGPPSNSLSPWGTEATWTCSEALDAAGAPILPPKREKEPREAVSVASRPDLRHAATTGLRLRDFEISKGLKRMTGKVQVKVASLVDVRMAATPGTKVNSPDGTLTVLSVGEHEKSEKGSTWKLTLQYEGKRLSDAFDPFVKIDDASPSYASFSEAKNGIFEVRTWLECPKPQSILFRARAASRMVEIPFDFKDLTWKKDP